MGFQTGSGSKKSVEWGKVTKIDTTALGGSFLLDHAMWSQRLFITLVLVSGFGYQFAGFGYKLFVMRHFFV